MGLPWSYVVYLQLDILIPTYLPTYLRALGGEMQEEEEEEEDGV